MSRKLSLSAFSLIHLSPADAVRTAALAGFQHVGVRVAALPNSVDHDMLGPSAARRETRRALTDTGLSVVDIEALWMTGREAAGSLEPVLEAGADLGATFVDVLCFDPDVGRASDNFAQLCRDAQQYGLRCSLEFMGFSSVATIQAARSMIARTDAAGAGVLVDPLHLFRTGGDVADVAETPASALGLVQLCDAPDADPQPDLALAREEAISGRLPPGEGVLPLQEFVRALPPDAAVGVEVPYVAGRGASEHARRLYAAATAVVGL
jgi:sugar phosphate isomerase/epimerase